MPPISVARRVRIPGYLIMATMLIGPIVDLWIRSSPMRIHSPAWRLGLLSAGASTIAMPLLALFVMFAIAAAAEDRGVSYLVSSLAAAAAGLCVLAAGVFILDALQMKGQVQANLADNYSVGTAWVAIRLLVSAAIFLVLAVSAFRTAGSASRRTAAPQAVKAPGVLARSGRSPAGATATGTRSADAV